MIGQDKNILKIDQNYEPWTVFELFLHPEFLKIIFNNMDPSRRLKMVQCLPDLQSDLLIWQYRQLEVPFDSIEKERWIIMLYKRHQKWKSFKSRNGNSKNKILGTGCQWKQYNISISSNALLGKRKHRKNRQAEKTLRFGWRNWHASCGKPIVVLRGCGTSNETIFMCCNVPNWLNYPISSRSTDGTKLP